MASIQETDRIREELEKLSQKNLVIIVEGPGDRRALETQGIRHIITLSKKPLFAVTEEAARRGKNCAILTDLDKKGKELYGKLKKDLQRQGVSIDDSFRNFLYKETQIRQIEGLRRYLQRQSKKLKKLE